MTGERICQCGTCQDAWDAALRDNVKSIEAGECMHWRIQIAAAHAAIALSIAMEHDMSRKDAGVYVSLLMMQFADFAKERVESARKPIADAYVVAEGGQPEKPH
jgi:hypothetical protein